MSSYRIVQDSFLGYEVQCRRWWFPVWVECWDGQRKCNTHKSLEEAIRFAIRKSGRHLYIDEWRLS